MQLRSTFLIAAAIAIAPLTAQGQILTERNISLQLALQIANAAMAQCKADGFDVTAAVVDRAGDLKVLLRADTANPHNGTRSSISATKKHSMVSQQPSGDNVGGNPADPGAAGD